MKIDFNIVADIVKQQFRNIIRGERILYENQADLLITLFNTAIREKGNSRVSLSSSIWHDSKDVSVEVMDYDGQKKQFNAFINLCKCTSVSYREAKNQPFSCGVEEYDKGMYSIMDVFKFKFEDGSILRTQKYVKQVSMDKWDRNVLEPEYDKNGLEKINLVLVENNHISRRNNKGTLLTFDKLEEKGEWKGYNAIYWHNNPKFEPAKKGWIWDPKTGKVVPPLPEVIASL